MVQDYEYNIIRKRKIMFREMRRKNQYIPEEECIEILKNASNGIMAVSGDNDYPYAVPLSYGYEDGKIFFHCAKTGHKIDAIKKNDKVSFTVVGQDKIVPELYTTYFKSVIVFGRAAIVEDMDEKIRLTKIIAQKYRPGFEKEMQKEIDAELAALCVVSIDIEHMTGKESKYLAQERNR